MKINEKNCKTPEKYLTNALVYIIITYSVKVFTLQRFADTQRSLSMEKEKNIEVSLLLDFYGQLLKPSGKEALELYYNEDLSLSEISEQLGITRQGVYDNVKRSEQRLFELEEKLGLFKRFRELEQGLDEIADEAKKIYENSDNTQIISLAKDIECKASILKE